MPHWCNSKNIHLKCLHLGIVWIRFVCAKTYPLIYFCVNKSQQNYTGGIFWHKQIIAKLYQGYILALSNHSETVPGVQFGNDFCSKTVLGYVLATNFICQNIPTVYLCVVEYVSCYTDLAYLQVQLVPAYPAYVCNLINIVSTSFLSEFVCNLFFKSPETLQHTKSEI